MTNMTWRSSPTLAAASATTSVQPERLKALSQDRLALLADLDWHYMGRIERGKVNITLENVYILAKALDCPITARLPAVIDLVHFGF